MRIQAIAACVALVAAACTPPAADVPVAQAEPATQTAKPGEASAVAPSAGEAPTPAMLVGRWGDNGDCSKDIVFSADGTYRSYTGGGGAWSLSGDVMTMSGPGGTFQVRVSILNGNQLLIGNPDGTIGISQRC
jgi:hypothetical protein